MNRQSRGWTYVVVLLLFICVGVWHYFVVTHSCSPFAITLICDEVAEMSFPFLITRDGGGAIVNRDWSIQYTDMGSAPESVLSSGVAYFVSREGLLKSLDLRTPSFHNSSSTVLYADTISLPWNLKKYKRLGGTPLDSELFLTQEGHVWGYGDGYFGRLGLDKPGITQYQKRQLPALESIVDIALIQDCGVALCEDGSLWQWGATGLEERPSDSSPIKVDWLSRIAKMHSGENAVYLIDEDGGVWFRGLDEWGLASSEIDKRFIVRIGNGVYFLPIYYSWQKLPELRTVINLDFGADYFHAQQASGTSIIFRRVHGDIPVREATDNPKWLTQYFAGDFGMYLDDKEASEYSADYALLGYAVVHDNDGKYQSYWTNGFGQIAVNADGSLAVQQSNDDSWVNVSMDKPIVQVSGRDGVFVALDEDGNLFTLHSW